MQRKRPDSLRIGAKTYRIAWMHEDWVSDDAGNLGQTNHHRLTVFISPNQHVHQKGDTLFHELFHCVMAQFGSLDNYTILGNELEEHIVTVGTPWFVLALRDNPEVLAYILDPW